MVDYPSDNGAGKCYPNIAPLHDENKHNWTSILQSNPVGLTDLRLHTGGFHDVEFHAHVYISETKDTTVS